jgi:phage tail-like protein
MAFRDRPFSQFNFTVDIDGVDREGPQAGFQEVNGLGLEVTVAEYRAGNWKDNTPLKITGAYKVQDVTLKRGVIGDDTLYLWLDQIRNGAQDAMKTVTISLLSEDRTQTAQSWKLTNARPTKYTGPQLSGKGTDVAVDELVLASERIDMDFPA